MTRNRRGKGKGGPRSMDAVQVTGIIIVVLVLAGLAWMLLPKPAAQRYSAVME